MMPDYLFNRMASCICSHFETLLPKASKQQMGTETSAMKRYKLWSILLILIVGIQAASCNRQGNTSASALKPKNIRLVVGKIREVRMPVPADTTIQLVASSENNEIVDVSKQTPGQPATEEVFLIKGVTPGTVKVTFARKKINEEGAGDITHMYQVRVVNR
jgi:hypothetical protein